jgi:transposase
MAKARRTFTPEFKVEAVKLVTEQGKSIAEVARDLDLGESMLRSWKQALATTGAQAFPGHGNPPARPPWRTNCAACGPRTSGSKWSATF